MNCVIGPAVCSFCPTTCSDEPLQHVMIDDQVKAVCPDCFNSHTCTDVLLYNGKEYYSCSQKKVLPHLTERKEPDPIQALLFLYERQTNDEINSKNTKHCNAQGFNSVDAKILTSIAEYYISRKFLSEKQLAVVLKRIAKYRKQISEMPADWDYFNRPLFFDD